MNPTDPQSSETPPASPPSMPPPEPMAPIPPKPAKSPIFIVMIVLAVVLFLIIAVAVLAGIAAPLIIRQKQKAEMTMTIANARQVGMGLSEFEMDYGRYPDASTAPRVAERTTSTIAPAGTSANAYLRQIIAAGIIPAESVFYAPTAYTEKPDEDISSTATALAPGELGFGYLLNGESSFNTDVPSRPLLCTPLAMSEGIISTSHFDPVPLQNHAVLLHIDNSARVYPLDPDSGTLTIDGTPWLETGAGTQWGTGVAPRVATPEPKR